MNREYRLKTPRPNKIVGFMINDVCNFSCEYCYQGFTNTKRPLEDSYKLIDKIAGFVEYLNDDETVISVEGGEPTLHFELLEYLFEKVKYLKYNKIILVTNMSHKENMKKIFEKYPDRKIVLNPSLHVTQVSNKTINQLFKNVMYFKEHILYVRIMLFYEMKTPPKSLKIFFKMMENNKIKYSVTPVMNLENTTKYDEIGFPYPGDEQILINGEEFNCNEIYKSKYSTKGMLCKNTGVYFFTIDGNLALFNCVNNREIKNIFKDTYEDIFTMDHRTICNLDHCSTCEFYDRYEPTEDDLDIVNENTIKLSKNLRWSLDDTFDPDKDLDLGLKIEKF